VSRILEGIFVIGCSLIGFGMSAPEGSGIHDSVERSAQLVAKVWTRVPGPEQHEWSLHIVRAAVRQ